ncbi:MAG: class F sortase [bacterium]|nr:class F sortase [bacterium]
MKNKKLLKILIGPLIIIATLLYGDLTGIQSWFDNRNNNQSSSNVVVASPATVATNEEPLVSGKPARLIITNPNIDLAVEPGNYNPADKSWTLSKTNLNWGIMTQPLNNKSGITYIYGHYKKGVLYDLPKISAGQEVTVTAEDGRNFVYRFRSSEIVEPHNANILSYQGPPILVIQTCTGLTFEKRQMFTFDYVRNS